MTRKNRYRKRVFKGVFRIKMSKENHIIEYGLVAIAVLSLILNFIMTYKTGYPSPSLKIIDLTLRFDDRAIDNPNYLDSIYVFIKLFNSGNEAAAISTIKNYLDDYSDTTIFSQNKFVKFPQKFGPGEIKVSLIKINSVKVSTNQILKYKLPYGDRDDYLKWKKISRSVQNHSDLGYLTIPLKRDILLRSVITYYDDYTVEKTRKLNFIEPIRLADYRNKN